MKKKRKVKKGSHKHRKGSNPFRRHGKKMFAGRRRRSSNPSMLSGGFNLLKFGAIALVGLVATRQIPQWVLGTKNQSWVGYAANALTALVLGYAAHKFVGKEAGSAVLIGGGLYTVSRIITEQVSPVGKVLSLTGLGDPMALSGIGPGYFPLPVPLDASGNPIIPAEIRAAVAASAGSGMRGLEAGSRFRSRFA